MEGEKSMFRSIVEAVAYHGENTPEKLCIVDETNALNYGEVLIHVNDIAEKLKAIGIERHDKVAMECTQDAHFLLCGLACQLPGAVFVPLEKSASKERVKEILEVTEAKCFICRGEYEADIRLIKAKEFLLFHKVRLRSGQIFQVRIR
jgi:acyl-CoA synthetase (AMP-forming)/AMP-acid ligase II